MTISLIVAMDANQVIGNQGALPWHLPEDLKYFKRITRGHNIIMGRKTFDSIGKALPERTNLVITRNPDWKHDEAIEFNSIEEVLHWIEETEQMERRPEQWFVIGGKEIFQAFYKYATKFYVTHIEHEFEGDTQWLEFNWDDWELVSFEDGIKNEKNPYDYWFAVYERKK